MSRFGEVRSENAKAFPIEDESEMLQITSSNLRDEGLLFCTSVYSKNEQRKKLK